MASTGTATAVRTSGARVFFRGLSEGVLGGLFFGGLFGMGIGLVITVLTVAELLPFLWPPPTPGVSDAMTLVIGGVTSAAALAMIGFGVGAVLGLGYGLVAGLASGAVVALLIRHRSWMPSTGRVRIAAASATLASYAVGYVLIARPSPADYPKGTGVAVVLFLVAPASIAAAFTAWRSPGWCAPPPPSSPQGLAQPSVRIASLQQLPDPGA